MSNIFEHIIRLGRGGYYALGDDIAISEGAEMFKTEAEKMSAERLQEFVDDLKDTQVLLESIEDVCNTLIHQKLYGCKHIIVNRRHLKVCRDCNEPENKENVKPIISMEIPPSFVKSVGPLHTSSSSLAGEDGTHQLD
jgi:hypothetical protein